LLKKQLHKIFKSKFARNAAIVTSGTALAQVFNAAFYPVITRLYSPEDFGIFTLFMASLGLLMVIGSLKYESSIPIADNEEKAINALSLCIIVILILSGVLALIFLFFGKSIFNTLNATPLYNYRYFLTLTFLLAVLYNILVQWNLRQKNFKILARTKAGKTLVMGLIKTGLGIISLGPLGLIFGKIFSEISGISNFGLLFFKKNKRLINSININEVIWISKRYKRFPIFASFSQLFNKAGLELPIFFITSLYGSSVVGLYGLSHIIVSLPVSLISNSVADVFYAEVASSGKKNPKKLKLLSNKLIKKLILIGVGPVLALMLFGPQLFSFIFGAEWYDSGVYARILALLVFARFIFNPISKIFYAFEKQKQSLLLNLLRVILVLLTFIIAGSFNLTSYQAVGLYSISMIIVYLSTFLYSRKIINDLIKNKE